MKIFFCAHDVVEFDGIDYYSNPISYMVKRYARADDILTCYAPIIGTPNPKGLKIDKSNVDFVDAPKISSIHDFLSINKNYKKLKIALCAYDCAIIHVHVSLINSLCVLAAKSTNTPFMTVVVGCAWDALWNHSLTGKFMASIGYLFERWCQKQAKYSIYVTSTFLQKRYPTNGKWIACSNVELDFEQSSHTRNPKNRNLLLGTVAAIDVRYKGQQYVLKALALLKKEGLKFQYHLIGGGSPEYLKNLAEKLGISEQVIFHGALQHDKIAAILDIIDIYIQPSKQEGLPRSVIEAMSRGCLCIGSDIAGIPELINSKYLFQAGDYLGISKILSEITPDDIREQSELNIVKANKYSKATLDSRRAEFISNFRKEIEK